MEPKQESFQYTYSAKNQEIIQNIRKKYAAPEEDKMAKLLRLEAGVVKKATILSILIGVIGALVMGIGMSLVMTDIGAALRLSQMGALIAGVVTGVIGMLIAALAYPVYQRKVKKEREKIAPEVLRLTDELMK